MSSVAVVVSRLDLLETSGYSRCLSGRCPEEEEDVEIVLGIHRDFVRHANGELQSYSDRWIELAAQRNIVTKIVDARKPGFFDILSSCNGFMWRFGYSALELELSKRVLQAVHQGMGIPVFPSVGSAWHFEDKIAQFYLLKAIDCPIPETEVLWSEADAMNYCDATSYPFVLKLSSGIQSRNVRLVRTRNEAAQLSKQMFRSGLRSLQLSPSRVNRQLGRALLPIKLLLGLEVLQGVQTGYFLVQEFLPDNEYDTRVTIIGDRAFAFRRMNRPGDFRASGSGNIDWNPDAVDAGAVHLAFKVSDALQSDSLAVDVLRKDGLPVVAEISYTYASWAVRDCPGHWKRTASGELDWVAGSLRPEDAIFTDFLEKFATARPQADTDSRQNRLDHRP